MSNCIACGNPQVCPFYNPGEQPLAALALPRTQRQALNSLRYPMDFQVCLRCGHVFNAGFDVAKVPYEDDSNLMYNSGSGWDAHLDNVVRILRDYTEFLAIGRVILDIGAGDGIILKRLQEQAEAVGVKTRCIAFEPGTDAETCRKAGLETYADYFIPDRDLELYSPDILVCRHVLEHLPNPREFVSNIARCACQLDQSPNFFVEVPCIEKALKQGRVGDFLYEHVGNFTCRSLCMMMESCGWETSSCSQAYDEEVIIWTGRPTTCGYRAPPAAFDTDTIRALINFTLHTYDNVVFWGGTGKSAAFLNAINAPITSRVIDSDVRKAGRFVPGTGQLIEPPCNLYKFPAEAVIITTRWRAADIYHEIKLNYPKVEVILVVEGDAIRQYTERDYDKETTKAR